MILELKGRKPGVNIPVLLVGYEVPEAPEEVSE